MRIISTKLIRAIVLIALTAVLVCSANVSAAHADYIINGVTVPLEEDGFRYGDYYGSKKCWDFVLHIYYTIWDRFFLPFAGTDDDVLRNYPKGEMRRITASNAKLFISAAPVGSVIRIMSTPYGADQVSSTSRHSLILLEKTEYGCVLYHAWAGTATVEGFTWATFETKFRSGTDFGYFKYIKCPGAEALEYNPLAAQENEMLVTARLTGTVEFTEEKR